MSKRTQNVRIIQVKPLHDPMDHDGNDTKCEEKDADTETDNSGEVEETADKKSSRSRENNDIALAGIDFGIVHSTTTDHNIQSFIKTEINADRDIAEAKDLKTGDDEVVVKKKPKKDKKRRKKKEKKEKIKEEDGQQFADNKDMAHDNKKNIPHRLSPIIQHKDEDLMKPQVQKVEKSGCCFGFISTWIAKRKAKRRQKKRQAIEARNNSSREKLKQYEHKQSKGGEAFIVALDNKTMTRKPVVPPIRPKSIHKGNINDRMVQAETRRTKHLIKKTETGAKYDRRWTENTERKEDIENGYKTKAQLTIIAKQGQAKRNKNKLDQERRCPSILRHVSSTMPPVSPHSPDIVSE